MSANILLNSFSLRAVDYSSIVAYHVAFNSLLMDISPQG